MQSDRILLIDSDPLLGDAISLALDDRYDVICVESVEDALRILGRMDFDLVLCELWLEEITGLDLYRTVCRCLPELSQRFVFLTDGSGGEVERAFMRTHAHRILVKPFTVETLTAWIGAFMGDDEHALA